MGQELPHGALPTVTSFYEEVTSEGDVTFQWARLPSGARATYELTQAPGGSAATVSLSGVLEGVDLPGSYVVVRSVYLGLGLLYREVGVCVWPQTSTPVLSLTSPSPVTVVAGTTTGAITFPEATGGTAPYTYTAKITGDSTGTYSSYVSSVSTRTVNLAALTNGQVVEVQGCVSDADGNTAFAYGLVLVASSAAGTMTPGAFPASQTLDADTTTASITFNDVGGTFTAPVTYVATISSGSGRVSNTGKSVSLSGLVNDGVTLVRLRATDSSGTPKTADAFALVRVRPSVENPLVWKKLRRFDFKAQGTVSLVNGNNTVTLTDDAGNASSVTLNNSMGLGSYTTMTATFSAATGWKHSFAATASATYLRGRVELPLGVTTGIDDDLRITIKGKINNQVSANSAYWQVSNADDLSEDATNAQGLRLLKSGTNTALYLRAAGSSGSIINSTSTPACPTAWQDGTTTIVEEIYVPRRMSRAIVTVNASGSIGGPFADLGHAGTTPGSNVLRPGWGGGKSRLYLQHYSANGTANGLGLQYSEIHEILIERRTLP